MLVAQGRHKVRRFKGSLKKIIGDHVESCAHLLAVGRYRFTVSKPEKKVLRRSKKIPIVEWAPKHFKIPAGPFESRYFSFDVTPHLYGMLQAYELFFINKVTVCAAPQTTKTTFAHIATGWRAKYCPGPNLHLYPTETSSEEIMTERIQRSFKESPQLKRLMTGRKEDVSKHKLRLNNMWIRMAWAGSLTGTAHRSVKDYVADEVDKYNERPSKSETTTLALLKIRGRTYSLRGGKGIIASSPSIETNFIWVEITHETQAVFVYWSKCPYCGTDQLMEFEKERFWWPKGTDGHSLNRMEIEAKRLARYICKEESCKKKWDDDARDKAQRLAMKGGWRLRTEDGSKGEEMMRYLNRERPASIGFIIPAWISFFVSLSECAAAFLKCFDKNLSPEEQFAAYQNFQNAYRSLPWRVEMQSQPVDKILAFCDDRPEGRIPGGERVASLLAAIDTQDNDLFYLSIWAIGWGFQNEQWLVLRKPLDSFEAIAQTLWNSEYFDMDGQSYVLEHAFIDMLGHRTKEVLEFCIQYEGLITPIYGSSRVMTQGYVFSQKEYMPSSDQPLPGGGIRAIRINTKYYKDNMAIKLSLDPDSAGCIHLYKDVGEDYGKQLTSEARDEKGNWKQIGSRANHYWDNWCAINCLADYLGVKYRIKPELQGDIELQNTNVVVANSQFMGG
ncbi:MAG: terminase gpA endonuclease subunit [Desulforhopalus sp.]